MAEIRLDPRLAAAAQMIRPGTRAADVGTDHGHLICYLAQRGLISSGIACDVNRQPLQKASQLIAKLGLEHMLCTRLCDGLRGVQAHEADDILLCGMGGELILDILSHTPWRHDAGKRFILQPMTRAPILRRGLYADGFAIQKEQGVKSGRFLYTVLLAQYTGRARPLTPLESLCGKLAENGDAPSRAFLLQEARRLRDLARGMAQSQRLAPQARHYDQLAAGLAALAQKAGESVNGMDAPAYNAPDVRSGNEPTTEETLWPL